MKLEKREKLFEELKNVISDIDLLEKENPPEPGQPEDPRVLLLKKRGRQIFSELDPMMRRLFRGHPAELASWEDAVLKQRFVFSEEIEEDDTDARIRKTLDEGMKAVHELDPLVREQLRDNPTALAEWESVMSDVAACDEEDTDKPPS